MEKNVLYYGDNLDVLRRSIGDRSVDLVYLDPPFNSNATYNVLFAEKNGTGSAAQIKVFEDTWQWDSAAAELYQEAVESGGKVSQLLQAFRIFLGENNLLAYLTMMAPRLVELRRALKPTGSIYLHCDPTASHYLKMVMDAVLGPENFRTEIVWKRSSAHSDTKQGRRQHGRIHDVILFYSVSREWTWNPQYTPYRAEYVGTEYRHTTAEGRRYKRTDLTAAKPGGDTEYEWFVKRKRRAGERWMPDLEEEYKKPQSRTEYRTVRPYKGRFWAYSKANLIDFWKQGRLVHGETGMPRLMQFADEMPGVALQDLWTDIPPEMRKKDLGYPTQKPELLLERIIASSSNPGDVVLDPFCGCGTAVAVAQRMDRRWIGVDITHLAISLIKNRLKTTFGDTLMYDVVGEPVSLPDAGALAAADPYQFQWWALGLVGARPVEQKKGADEGVDGRIYFHDEAHGTTKQIILSVKSGHVSAKDIRELRAVVEREGAQIGALLTLQSPTKPMRQEAASVGFYESAWGKHPRIQIRTIGQLLAGMGLNYPRAANVTLKQAPKHKREVNHEANDLPFVDE